MSDYCKMSGETVYRDTEAFRLFEPTADGRHRCPYCGRPIKLRRHPGGAPGTLQAPRHMTRERRI